MTTYLYLSKSAKKVLSLFLQYLLNSVLTIYFRPPYSCSFTKCQFKKDPYVGNIICKGDLAAIFQITIFFVAFSFLCSLSRLWCFHYGHISDRHVLRRLISVLSAFCKLWFQESHFYRIFRNAYCRQFHILQPLASFHLSVFFLWNHIYKLVFNNIF